ncbi:hypothetical protein SLOPH_1773 [Spraguea lophii 42_110]|uniref:Uncharacterized protein n=1 Tax=Spraguea lophii (strain 42_110) TaxID=1358809 RepID=S7XJW2_SPRLO|nr:hypothetical protein SLOPH_1773 [Spraguea lophii 42_110]
MKKFTEKLFLRHNEVKKIREFLSSKEKILHISGNPGTGKTFTVKATLKNRKYKILNFFRDNITKNIKSSKNKLLVIDEFDKYYQTHKDECINCINSHQNKIITISNDLTISSNILYFKPYTTEEMIFILENKLKELNIKISEDILKYISKDIEYAGDIRKSFNYIQTLVKNNKNITFIDIIKNNQKEETNENLHYKIIKKIINDENIEENNYYSEYYIRCKEYKIIQHTKNDFYSIVEIITNGY